MRVRKVVKTRIYSRKEIKYLSNFMVTYDKLHEICENTPVNISKMVDVEPNYVRPTGKKVVAANGCTYYVCGHHQTNE